VGASRTMRGSDVIGDTRVNFCKLSGRCGIPSSLTSWVRQLVFDACQPRRRPGNCALLTYIHSDLSTTVVAGARGGVGAVGWVGVAGSAAVGDCVGGWVAPCTGGAWGVWAYVAGYFALVVGGGGWCSGVPTAA
jgi:hypothetical protein